MNTRQRPRDERAARLWLAPLGAALAGVSWGFLRLARRHGQTLRGQARLRERLVDVETPVSSRRGTAWKSALLTDDARFQPRTSPRLSITYRPVRLKGGETVQIALDPYHLDPIGEAVMLAKPWFLDDYDVLLQQMKPGDRVVDLGGHIGTFSLAAAALGCEVLCVEADPASVYLIQAGKVRNGFDRLTVVHAAAMDQEGTVELLPSGPWGTISNPTVLAAPSAIQRRSLERVAVPARTVESLLRDIGWDQVSFLKIDIEGSEMAAMRGMEDLLSRSDAPILLFESNGHALHFFGETTYALIQTVHDFGYHTYQLETYRLERWRLVPVAPGELQPECTVNYLATKGPPPRLEGWDL
ncbi:MAG: FkbM family methyltransferase, partial [Chloroflexi bacterium]|nr:FkbM family methyltransferase [Chloroflexota bacterium]